MPFFFCRLNSPRPTFAVDMSEAERMVMGEHAAYWRANLGLSYDLYPMMTAILRSGRGEAGPAV